MGVTHSDILNLEKLFKSNPPNSVLELGSQYLYNNTKNCIAATSGNPAYAKTWFQERNIAHTSIDLNGEADLNIDIINNNHNEKYDWVTDYGTIEHTNNVYLAFKNCHEWVNDGGLMIHVNPKTGNWPGHGNWYFTQDFYRNLADKCNYKILMLSEIAAMGNAKNGWNVFCVLQKNQDSSFEIKEKNFNDYLYKE